ncbi:MULTISPECIES: aminotransferase [unclassified Rhizobium]|uniref:aminotransferase n=1 Tax=unclassified Rhizobium TaxID=2613769 RepID=UPI00161C3061|nr:MULTISPECIES: aminotransferase [unclassified Rhizobium]MBB3289481.1 aspartate/methionine/tyrosine aminotransferase [Rhizobium sp. BK252]MBB3404423.1 aspartate/methionine/tyrosine aminotransferase [Rhizobium sp. BK289]MBB3416809.1 aspartate/methionine/tyrosine aminotransferase [Rhizobium sp. BK284]MBB3484686.1 aspartate/methionine/tyrosine aminotransferase [Rhizobium sp. BK347]
MTAAKFNSFVSRLSPPPIPSVVAWGREYKGLKGPLIDLSQAVPGYPAHPEMLRLLGETAAQQAMTGYGPIEGEPLLRQIYAAHVAELYGADISADNIHITAGCNQAFMCTAIALAGAGDTVALTNPFYFNHDTTLSMLGIGRLLVDCDPTTDFLPDLGSAEAALAAGTKMLAVVTPNNPTGAVYPPGLLHELFLLCRKYGAWLVVDETYRDFLAEDYGRPHALLSEPGWEDTLVLLYSFSKSFCIPGHRLGAVTAGPGLIAEIAKVMDNMQICAPRSAQIAVASALPVLADWRAGNRLEIARRADALRQATSELMGWEIAAIGAYFAFVRHPFEGRSSSEVAEELARERGVICIPGAYFGEGQERYLRFAFANVDVASIRLLPDRLR